MNARTCVRSIVGWLTAPPVGRCQGVTMDGLQCSFVATQLLTFDTGGQLEVCPTCAGRWQGSTAATLQPLDLPLTWPDMPSQPDRRDL